MLPKTQQPKSKKTCSCFIFVLWPVCLCICHTVSQIQLKGIVCGSSGQKHVARHQQRQTGRRNRKHGCKSFKYSTYWNMHSTHWKSFKNIRSWLGHYYQQEITTTQSFFIPFLFSNVTKMPPTVVFRKILFQVESAIPAVYDKQPC